MESYLPLYGVRVDNVSSCAHIDLRWWRRSYLVVPGLWAGATGGADHDRCHDDHDAH